MVNHFSEMHICFYLARVSLAAAADLLARSAFILILCILFQTLKLKAQRPSFFLLYIYGPTLHGLSVLSVPGASYRVHLCLCLSL